jgi:hypothetical protein
VFGIKRYDRGLALLWKLKAQASVPEYHLDGRIWNVVYVLSKVLRALYRHAVTRVRPRGFEAPDIRVANDLQPLQQLPPVTELTLRFPKGVLFHSNARRMQHGSDSTCNEMLLKNCSNVERAESVVGCGRTESGRDTTREKRVNLGPTP